MKSHDRSGFRRPFLAERLTFSQEARFSQVYLQEGRTESQMTHKEEKQP